MLFLVVSHRLPVKKQKSEKKLHLFFWAPWKGDVLSYQWDVSQYLFYLDLWVSSWRSSVWSGWENYSCFVVFLFMNPAWDEFRMKVRVWRPSNNVHHWLHTFWWVIIIREPLRIQTNSIIIWLIWFSVFLCLYFHWDWIRWVVTSSNLKNTQIRTGWRRQSCFK